MSGTGGHTRSVRIGRATLLVLATAVLCSCESSTPTQADCEVFVRNGTAVYLGSGHVEQRPDSTYDMVERSACSDVGEDAGGAHFPRDADERQAWRYDDVNPEDSVVLKEGDSWRAYVNTELSDREQRQVLAPLETAGK